MSFYLYDRTNNVLIEPSSFKLLSNSGTISDQFSATFQTPYNSTQYRLIIHVASTSASAYSLKFDDIQVSPSNYVYGTPITDWQNYTPAITGFGTVTQTDIRFRRAGQNLELTGKFTSGTSTATTASIPFPPGLVANTEIS